jgi:hypothetical protein
MVKRPHSDGRFQVRGPELANLAPRGEILWNLYANQRHCVSNILRNKYLDGIPRRNIQEECTPKGT